MNDNIKPNSGERGLFLLGCATHCNSNDVFHPHNNLCVGIKIEVESNNSMKIMSTYRQKLFPQFSFCLPNQI